MINRLSEKPVLWSLLLSAILGLLVLLPLFSNAQTGASYNYQVSFPNPGQHYVSVQLKVENIHQDTLELRMPVWTPGYYWILDLTANLFDLEILDQSGKKANWGKTSKNCWQIVTKGITTLQVSYQVYANAHSVAEPYCDETKAFLSPTGIFMFNQDQPNAAIDVNLQLPANWQHAYSGLDQNKLRPNSWKADGFDELYDCPIIAGNQKVDSFQCENRWFYLVFDQKFENKNATINSDLQRIIQSAYQLMGDIPFSKYYFFFLGDGFGGLEHRNSMAVFGDTFPSASEQPKEYLRFMSFLAHEYFHLYNVKAIRPFALGPFNYNGENYTNMLWVSEGFTVYYEYVLLLRAGFINAQQFIEYQQNVINHFENLPGRKYQSATQSSYDTWLNFFRFTNVHTQNTTLSYYDIGCTLGLIIDLEIRNSSGNQYSLDDVMRYLYKTYYLELKRGFTDREFQQACEKFSGKPLDELFVYAANPVPFDYSKYLSYAGLDVVEKTEFSTKSFYGLTIEKRDSGWFVTNTAFDTEAFKSGILPDDQLIEINHMPVTDELINQLQKSEANSLTADIVIERQGIKIRQQTHISHETIRNYTFVKSGSVNEKQKAILAKWLPGLQ